MRIVNFNRRTKKSTNTWLNTWIDWNKIYCQDLNNKVNSLYNYTLWWYPEYTILNSTTALSKNENFQPFKSLSNIQEEPRLVKPYEEKIKVSGKFKSVFFPSRLNYHQGFYNQSDYGDALLCYYNNNMLCTYQSRLQENYQMWVIQPEGNQWPDFIDLNFDYEMSQLICIFAWNNAENIEINTQIKSSEIEYYFQKDGSKLILNSGTKDDNVLKIFLLHKTGILSNKEFYYYNSQDAFYKGWDLNSKQGIALDYRDPDGNIYEYKIYDNKGEIVDFISCYNDNANQYYIFNDSLNDYYILSTIIKEDLKYDFPSGFLCMLNKQPTGENIETNIYKLDLQNYLIAPVGNGGYYDIYWNNQDLCATYYANELGNFTNQISINLAQNCRYLNPDISLFQFASKTTSINIGNWQRSKACLTDKEGNIWTGHQSLIGQLYFEGEPILTDVEHNTYITAENNKKIHYFNMTLKESLTLKSELWLY